MMDFFTHCLKNNQFKRAVLLRCFVALIFITITTIQGAHAASPDSTTTISSLQVERGEGAVFLNAQVAFDLPAPIQDVLLKGIPLYFVAETEVRRDRWYWYDKKIATSTRQMRLAYQPLTRKWRLNIYSGSTGSGGALGGGLLQYFDSLAEALSKVQRISRWRIAEVSELDPDVAHTIELSFKLDISQLPRPFQIGLIGQVDWNISTAKSIRFTPEVNK